MIDAPALEAAFVAGGVDLSKPITRQVAAAVSRPAFLRWALYLNVDETTWRFTTVHGPNGAADRTYPLRNSRT